MYIFLSKYVHFDKYLLCWARLYLIWSRGGGLFTPSSQGGISIQRGTSIRGGTFIYFWFIFQGVLTSIKEGMFIWHYRVYTNLLVPILQPIIKYNNSFLHFGTVFEVGMKSSSFPHGSNSPVTFMPTSRLASEPKCAYGSFSILETTA